MPPFAPATDERLEREIVELEPLELRASVVPSSWNEEDRSVEVTWTAGADVLRYDWRTDQRYWERLDFAPDAVRLERLNSGKAPVLDAHSSWSSRDVVGVVVAGSVKIDTAKRTGTARIRFTGAPDAAPTVQRVREGVLASFSFGYSRELIEQTSEVRDGYPVWVVRRWEPYEISPVPIPADAGTGTRSDERRETRKTPCEILRRSNRTMPPESITPTEAELAAKRAAEKQEAEAAERRKAEEAERKKAAEAATAAERTRSQEIRDAIRKAKLSDEQTRQIEKDYLEAGKSSDEARKAILDLLAARDEETETRNATGVGRSDDEKIRAELGDGLLLRAGRRVEKAGDLAKQFRHMRATSIAAFFLRRAGERPDMLSEQEIARRALSTSDFAHALSNVQAKTLRQAYNEAPRTFEPFVRRTTLGDFKPAKRVAMSGAPSLTRVLEGQGIPNGQVRDYGQGIRLFKYGTVLAVTWETLVNDDLDAIMREGLMFGASAASLEGDLVYGIITSNQVMDEDSVAMIHSTHGNTTTGALSVANLSTARGKLRKMVGPAPASRPLNLEGRFILTGPDLEIEASKYLADIVAEQAGNVNPLKDKLRGVIADTRLPGTKWWMAATPDQIDTIELASLAGVEDIMVDENVDFRTKSVETSALVHRAAAAIDWRWIVESTGS